MAIVLIFLIRTVAFFYLQKIERNDFKCILPTHLNEYERQRRIAESTKKLYPPGTRIELISMKDPYAPVLAGTRGTVKFVDSMGTIFPEWDNGRSLGVVPGEDSFRKLTQEEIEAENQSMSEVEDETPDEDNGMTMRM